MTGRDLNLLAFTAHCLWKVVVIAEAWAWACVELSNIKQLQRVEVDDLTYLIIYLISSINISLMRAFNFYRLQPWLWWRRRRTKRNYKAHNMFVSLRKGLWSLWRRSPKSTCHQDVSHSFAPQWKLILVITSPPPSPPPSWWHLAGGSLASGGGREFRPALHSSLQSHQGASKEAL